MHGLADLCDEPLRTAKVGLDSRCCVYPDGRHVPVELQIGYGTRPVATQRMFSQGTVVPTGNPLDVSTIQSLSRKDDVPLPEKGGFTVVNAGRFVPQKNQDLLLHAFAAMADDASRLWMLGQGPLEEQLRSTASAIGIDDRVEWLGYQDNPFPYYRAADCLVLSSDWEGLPNVILESMVCETAVVSTRCPHGPDELIEDGVSGCLVPAGDEEAMAATLARLRKDPALRGRMSGAAQSFVQENYADERTIQEYADLFEQLAHREPS